MPRRSINPARAPVSSDSDSYSRNQKPISVDIPASVDLVVTDTPPALKGATATNQSKEATLENGLKVRVPPFISPGEKVRIDTRVGRYIERVG